MSEETSIIKQNSKTRFQYAVFATGGTFLLIAFGNLSDAGEVASFSFLGVVAAGLGISKFAEYWRKD